MLNPINLLSKLFKSGNQKELDRINLIVEKINHLEEETRKLEDIDFPKKTTEFKELIKKGKKLENVRISRFRPY